ncbi:phage portal protein [Mesorhizobium muleiense]|uniref:phage portal protein n=1 Tax=Mesorhizobium muleiense TaxID=1004279 RepID=UPI001F29FC8A|nr:phage portal protein [Mesorhizobium muleiense]MCF6111988.1 phage portal protein [Mesorhizobium muleiense]
MGFLVKAAAAPFKLFNAISDEVAKERRLRLSDGPGWSNFFGRESNSGKSVSIDSTMQLSAAWACIKLSAQAVSSLPGDIYEKQAGDSRVKVDDDEIGDVIFGSPNEDQTPLEYWEGQVAWLMTSGNAYSEKVFNGTVAGTRNPRLSALQPMMSTHCKPVRKSDGTLVYRFNDRGKTEDLPRDKVFHIKGFGQGLKNADEGLSPIAAGVNSLGAAMASQEAAAKTFANGMRPTGFFLFDQVLKPEQRAQAHKALVDPLQGSHNAGGVGILEAGVKWQGVSLNPEDAQMLESRRFDVEEICRWFGTPPIIIGHAAEGQTMWGSGVEAILIAWLTLGIDPICDRIEARIQKQLIRPAGKKRRYAEFNREALLQMDSKAKANFLSTMVQNGLMDRNEGRAKLNLPNRAGADQLTAQTNLAPLNKLGEATGGNQVRAALMAWLGLGNEGNHDEQA